jgi:hypothetical protein
MINSKEMGEICSIPREGEYIQNFSREEKISEDIDMWGVM